MRQIMRKHPRRTIVIGFLIVIFIGSVLLMLSLSEEEGKRLGFVDSLFTSTSAVCVTGLVVVDTGDTFSAFGETIIALLIQIGGLGITSIGVITILITKGKMGMGGRKLAKEALNLTNGKGLRDVLKAVLYVTFTFEGIGLMLSFVTFIQQYKPLQALGISAFHSIASFNNAGFDIFGGFKSLEDYHDDVYFNLVTAGLIIIGGIGFFVIRELVMKRSWKKFSLHTKIVVTMTSFLIVAGTLLIKTSEDTTWLSAFFHSVSARTAGFDTESIGGFSTAGILIIIALMFIGASPGSTGGGIKTTTFFVLFRNMGAVALNKDCTVYNRRIPEKVISKALVVAFLAISFIFIAVLLISLFQPEFALRQVIFEVVSAFGTVGLSTGITTQLTIGSKLVLIATMFIGRIGPFTIITLWWRSTRPEARYAEEDITVG